MKIKSLVRTISDMDVNIKEQDILDRLDDRFRWPKTYPWGQPTVEVIKEDRRSYQDFFLEDGYIDSNKCIKYYQDGYTLIISKIGFLHKEARKVKNELDNFFHFNINCNFYFGTGKKSTSFSSHAHNYDVLIKNIYGSSVWLLNNKETTLDGQRVFYLPKGTKHRVTKITDKKLSMTCNLQYPEEITN
jgi:hypothetical protein